MADIKKTLPPSVGSSQGVDAILESCDLELDRLEAEARAACCRLAAATADAQGCLLWEKELGLDIREDLPLAGRRALIQVALDQMDTCTPEKLRAFVNRMLAGEVSISEDFDAYSVQLAAQVTEFLVPSLRAVEKALRRVTPAHLDYHVAAAAGFDTIAGADHALIQGMKLEIYTTEEETT